MQNSLPSLIELFGSISGIIITFLVLLYESSKRWIDRAKREVIFEVQNCLNCSKLPKRTQLKAGHELYDSLKEDCIHETVDTEHTTELLNLLKSIVNDLRNKDIETIEPVEAGERAKDASHIEKYHIKDIENARKTYDTANTFYQNFPNLAKKSIGIPLLICFLFILINYFYDNIKCLTNNNFVDYLAILLALIGLYFVYSNSVKSLVELKEIDK